MRLIPFLFLAGTLLFVFGKKMVRGAVRTDHRGNRSWLALGGITVAQFFIAVYGGFFGGGIGILMLASFTFLPLSDIHAMNGLKTLLASTINAVAIVTFIVAKIVFWPQAVLMLVGAAIGGYGGAHFAQKVNPARVRTFVIFVGFVL